MRAGLNRFVWDLHYPDTKQVKDVDQRRGLDARTVRVAGLVLACGSPPADKRKRGRSSCAATRVSRRRKPSTTRSLRLRSTCRRKTNELSDAVKRILDIQHALDDRVADTKGQAYAKRVADAAKPIKAKLEAIRDSLVEIHSHADQITLHYPVRYYNMLLSLAGMVQSADAAPTDQEGGIYREIAPKVDQQIARLRAIESGDLAAFNALMRELNVPAVMVAAPVIVP